MGKCLVKKQIQPGWLNLLLKKPHPYFASGQSPAGDLLIKIIEPYSFLFGVAIAMEQNPTIFA